MTRAEIYSYTLAMMPNNKESAYLHIPAFTSGIFLHIGTFLSIALFVVFFFVDPKIFPEWLTWTCVVILLVSAISGLSLLIKRMVSGKLRDLSNVDDFISNLLTTLFHIVTIFYLIFAYQAAIYYYIEVSLLLLYLPVGKLRHVIYFFAARYHLGFFYGWRNTWPPQKMD
ncbi:MAG: hypothetical protein LBH92_04465 [Bacteroidales bacterium]|nr:hypothetical protein [Bacteroidales bacterium]